MTTESAERWPGFTAKLITRQEIAERPLAVRFERPAGWTFEAGCPVFVSRTFKGKVVVDTGVRS